MFEKMKNFIKKRKNTLTIVFFMGVYIVVFEIIIYVASEISR